VIAVQVTDGSNEVLIGTRDGMAIRFGEDDVRAMGRTAYGVRGITLRGDDYVVGMEVIKTGGTILTVTEHGYGKRTEVGEYRVTGRGGLGIINIDTSERNGQEVGVAYVEPSDEVLCVTQQGMMLRTRTDDIRLTGRAAQGVRLIDLEDDDRVVAVAKLDPDETVEDENGGANGDGGASEPTPGDGGPAPAGDAGPSA
jgi:DNA gyrase subunit A